MRNILIQWDYNRYSVHSPLIDKQHQMLISIINEFFSAFQEGKAHDLMADILQQLIDYTIYHFNAEEVFLRKYNTPNINEHLKEHAFFVAKIKNFQNDFFANKATVTYELMTFLKQWLTEHILGKDVRDVREILSKK